MDINEEAKQRLQTVHGESAPTDRPVEQFTEINPPPHETIPDSVDAVSSPELASIQQAVRATPPPVPVSSADLINQLVGTAGRELKAAHRNRVAVLCMTSGFGASVNHFYDALGELQPEDVAHYRRVLTALSESLEMARGRLDLLIDASAPKQAAE